MNGCDLASYQGRVDFDGLKSAVDFVIVKATEGAGFTDPTFARNWREAQRVGLIRGAYHFARPDLGNTATIEADWFIDQIKGEGGYTPKDKLALDYEIEDWNGPVVAWSLQFLERVRAQTDITPDIYLNLYLSHVYDWSPVIDAGFPLWLADYDGLPDKVIWTPWPRVAIKQWTSRGTLPGINGLVDLNSTPEEAMTAQETYDLIAPLLQQNIVAPLTDTDNAIKAQLATLAAGPTDPAMRVIATKLAVLIEGAAATK